MISSRMGQWPGIYIGVGMPLVEWQQKLALAETNNSAKHSSPFIGWEDRPAQQQDEETDRTARALPLKPSSKSRDQQKRKKKKKKICSADYTRPRIRQQSAARTNIGPGAAGIIEIIIKRAPRAARAQSVADGPTETNVFGFCFPCQGRRQQLKFLAVRNESVCRQPFCALITRFVSKEVWSLASSNQRVLRFNCRRPRMISTFCSTVENHSS